MLLKAQQEGRDITNEELTILKEKNDQLSKELQDKLG